MNQDKKVIKIKPMYKFGLLNSILGLIVGLYHYYFVATGKGYEVFIFFAPIAIFIIATLSWKIKIKNKEYDRGNLIALGFISGSLSHPLTFYLAIIYSNIDYWIINCGKATYSEQPLNLLLGIPASIFYSIFSLIIYGWFTVSASILISMFMTLKKKNTANSNLS